MAYIQGRQRPLPRTALSQGIGLGTALLTGLMATTAGAADTANDTPIRLQEVSVKAAKTGDYKANHLSSTKFTRPVAETPQTVQIITRDLIDDQHAGTLTEALKNSPGVGTFFVGENGSTSTGDSVYMRGFDSSGAIFVDGVRDLGSISRDTFNIDRVEVIKGPAGTDYGRTAPSGSINLVSKQPFLDDANSASLSAGTGHQKRGTADFNHAFGEHGAARLNLMGQDSGVPGRDDVKNRRWGIAPSLAFGLNTPTRVYLDYLHITQNNIPDGGVPTVGLPGYTSPDPSRPSLSNAARVDTDNFYGTDHDHDDVDVDLVTAIVEHDIGESSLLRNTTRWGRTHQDYMLSSFMASSSYFNTPDLDDPSTWSIRRLPNYKDQSNEILTNQTGIVTRLRTGPVAHTLSYGLELTREKIDTTGETYAGTVPDVNLYDPQHDYSFTTVKTGADGSGTTDTVAAYLFDTLDLTERWQVTAGLRLDHYRAHFESSAVCGGRRGPDCGANPTGTVVPNVDASVEDNLFTWKLGTLYKLTRQLNLYADYAVSAQPPGGDDLQLSTRDNSADNPDFDPQKAHTAEVGAKIKLAGNRVLLTAALYRTTVTNLIEQDPTDPSIYVQTGKKRVQGVELAAVGNLTPNWNLSAGFTTMHATILDGSSETADGGQSLSYTPDKAFTGWTTYRLPFKLTVGGGARYTSGLKRGSDGAVGTPDHTNGYWVVDAMASYPITRDLNVQLNVYNVFDKHYVAAINKSGYRYTPGTPRSAVLSLNMTF